MPSVASLRAAAVFCAVAIVFVVCFIMLRQVIGGESPWLGLLLMFYFMGLAKVGERLFVLRIPSFIGEVRNWEAMGRTYNRLGVQLFGQLLRCSPLRYLNTSVYLRHRDLQSLYKQTASAEATHFWAGLLFTPYIVFVCVRGHSAVAMFFLVIQVLFNVYPILHLRLLRRRLDTLFGNRDAKRGQGWQETLDKK